jgi:peptide deformylase
VSVQPIRLFGDPVLRTPAQEVTTFDLELRKLVADLVDTMHDEGGAGLAAPQLGVGLRVFSYSCDGFEGHLINPTFDLIGDEEQIGPEGCLSIPGLSWDCRRHLHVVARGWDQHGEPVTVQGSELLARCIQHETDHLDGVLFVDRLDPAVRKLAMAEIRAAEWFGADPSIRSASPGALSATGLVAPTGSASTRSASATSAATRAALNPGMLAAAPVIKVSPHPMFGKAR